MIGLLDYDWETSTSTTSLIPNLEIMKLASYYRSENQFCRLMSLDETDFSHYDKIYFFSEYAKDIQIPPAFLRAPNIIYGGTNFTNGEYIPFQNSIIDFSLPRTSIYKESLKQKYNDGIKTKVIEHALDDTYYRMYAGEEKLPIPVVLPRKRVFLYDKEFFYDDWQEIIDDVIARRPASIQRIHPIACKTLTQYFAVRENPKIARSNDIILDLDIPLDEVHYMLKNYKNKFLADITRTSNVYISIGGSWPTTYMYYNDLIYKLNLLYCFWSYGIMLKTRYESPMIGYSDPLSHLSKLIVTWSALGKNQEEKTIFDRIPKKKKKHPIKEEYTTLIKMRPTAKDLFDQSFEKVKKGGRWRV